MKNLYHLFVTRYRLRVKLPRFCFAKSPLQNLKGIIHRFLPSAFCILLFAFLFLPFFALAQPPVPMLEAEVTDVVFSCPGIVEITYDLVITSCKPLAVYDVTLYYSSENCDWTPAVTEENVQPGTGKTITWDAAADNASFGKFYYKVKYTLPHLSEPVPVLINGVKWAPVNLDEGGWFCANPWESGGYYQWGRQADGHECLTSDTTRTLSPTDDPGHSDFILVSSSPYDWLASPNDLLWNSGTEAIPEKTVHDPCPDGWRVPTQTQLRSLTNVSSSLITQNGIAGYLVKNVPDTGSSLFFPMVSYRRYNSGLLTGSASGYWSSTSDSADAYYLRCNSTYFDMVANPRAQGFLVRCVSEN